MPSLRRATGFALTLLLFHLVLVGSGFTCVADDGRSGGSMAEMGMGDMAMADMPGMATNDATGANDDSSSGSPQSDPAPCNLPWAPNGCTLMIPCGPHALTAQAQTIAARQAASHAGMMLEIATPPSAIIALDTPPPRA